MILPFKDYYEYVHWDMRLRYRVQKSVFECRIDNGRYNKLIRGISKIHDENDLVRVYRLNEMVDIKNWGDYIDLMDDDLVIF